MSEDEDDQENGSYNNSFIDDRSNPTPGCTSAEDSGRDMMAIYRFLISFTLQSVLFHCYILYCFCFPAILEYFDCVNFRWAALVMIQ